MFKQNNKTIALNILFIQHNTEEIRLAYKSKYNRKRENQVVLLMITDGGIILNSKVYVYLMVKNGTIVL